MQNHGDGIECLHLACNWEGIMFFYISLFIACIAAAVLVLYLYHAITDIGREIYRAMLPSAKDNGMRARTRTLRSKKVNKTPTPWGWKGNNNGVRPHGSRAANLKTASGLDAFLEKNTNASNDGNIKGSPVGWPYREEKTALSGRTYKVTRTTANAKRKPWGW